MRQQKTEPGAGSVPEARKHLFHGSDDAPPIPPAVEAQATAMLAARTLAWADAYRLGEEEEPGDDLG